MNLEDDSDSNLYDIVLTNRNRANRIQDFDFDSEGSTSNGTNEISTNTDLDPQTATYSIKKVSKKSDSEVWKYFGTLYKNAGQVLKYNKRIFCRLCFDSEPRKFKRRENVFHLAWPHLASKLNKYVIVLSSLLNSYAENTSATNLFVHLQSKHGIQKQSKSVEIKQRKLTNIFFKKESAPSTNSVDSKFLLGRRLALWLSCDLLPLSLVEKIGFRDFWKSCQPKEELPSRKTVSYEALEDVYICMKTQLIKTLKAVPVRCCITFDIWTDSYRKHSYCTYTYHYLQNWNMFYTVLKTARFDHPHTGETLKDNFGLMIREYGLEEKKIIPITDGGSNVKKCCELLNLQRFSCIAHSCNRLIQHDLLENKDLEILPIKDVITKIRKTQRSLVYRFSEMKALHDKDNHDTLFLMLEEFNESDAVWDCEEQFCDMLEEADHGNFDGIKSMSRIRWTCIQKTVKCHLKYQSIIRKTLETTSSYDLVLIPREIEILDGLSELLDVFQVFTELVQGNSYCTINLIPLLYTEIEDRITTMQLMCSNRNIQKAAEILLSKLESRIVLTEEIIAAACVDPALQHLDIVERWLTKKELTRSRLLKNVMEKWELSEMQSSGNSLENQVDRIGRSSQQSENFGTTKKTISDLISKHALSSPTNRTGSIEHELINFRDLKNEINVLDFWKRKANCFPNMASLADFLLGIPMTTSTSEGAFSTASSLLRKRRSKIDPLRAEKILFIHDNYHLLDRNNT